MTHNGKRLLKDVAQFTEWALETIGAWASDALDDVDECRAEMLRHPPPEYPVIVVWKGVRTFDYWYVLRADFGKDRA